MSARGIPVQDTYPEGLQLRPVQEGPVDEVAVAEEAPVEEKPARRQARRKDPVVEAPSPSPADDE